ncbi:MAG: flagellar basal-body rod protein FlgF [Thioalkalispiraceae bacterium]|jgi:flagellar basal-body rod protein FlgF
MDKVLYTAMSGAKQTMLAQAANSNNIANVSTPGFRADYAQFRSMPVFGPGLPSRVYAMTERSGTDLSAGSINATGNGLDIAINGDGWIAVQASDGSEAYTRAGNMRLTTEGLLVTGSGFPVMGEGGPITLPPVNRIEIGEDGTISMMPLGEEGNELNIADRIKLVNPAKGDLYKGVDGLMRVKSGPADADANVKVVSGMLESSNVNVATALVNMIDLSRQYETQVKVMREAEQNADAARELLRMA